MRWSSMATSMNLPMGSDEVFPQHWRTDSLYVMRKACGSWGLT